MAMQAIGYSLAVSGAFVGSLYLLVPSRIRKLDRNDIRQIQWRSFATSVICVGSLASYRYMFGDYQQQSFMGSFSVYNGVILGDAGRVVLHSVTLYLGPVLQGMLQVHESNKQQTDYGIRVFWKSYYAAFCQSITRPIWKPLHESERWIRLRNLVIAPIAEEICFRGCIASALATTGMSIARVTWVAPLFFGTAHLHHALVRLYEKQGISMVLLQMAFQFAYTTLFGAYATYAFLCTRSIVAVSLSHSVCNSMGLPDLAFMKSSSSVHEYRRLLWAAHVAGIVGFAMGFRWSLVFP
jgi:prenyl protein peptidase